MTSQTFDFEFTQMQHTTPYTSFYHDQYTMLRLLIDYFMLLENAHLYVVAFSLSCFLDKSECELKRIAL